MAAEIRQSGRTERRARKGKLEQDRQDRTDRKQVELTDRNGQ
jgi:hypothetical protein